MIEHLQNESYPDISWVEVLFLKLSICLQLSEKQRKCLQHVWPWNGDGCHAPLCGTEASWVVGGADSQKEEDW